MIQGLTLRPAQKTDCKTILGFIKELAEFEKLSHEVVATEEQLQKTLFGTHPAAEVIIAELNQLPVGFALFFQSYSTFLAQPGIYLEDLYVTPQSRSKGIGEALLIRLAQIAVDRNCGRFEWSVLDWNVKAIEFYHRLGAKPQSEWTVQRVAGATLKQLAERAL